MGIELSPESWQVLVAFGCYLIGVAALGIFSHRYLTRGSFVKEYFLGNRGLGPWVLALTVAATAISGGTFMGFPSLIYTNGWVMALWICQLHGRAADHAWSCWANASTRSPASPAPSPCPTCSATASAARPSASSPSLLILLFLIFNLVAQFKAGGLVMKEALRLPPAPAEIAATRRSMPTRTSSSPSTRPTAARTRRRHRCPTQDGRYLPDKTDVDEPSSEVRGLLSATATRRSSRHVTFPPQTTSSIPWLASRRREGLLLGLFIFAVHGGRLHDLRRLLGGDLDRRARRAGHAGRRHHHGHPRRAGGAVRRGRRRMTGHWPAATHRAATPAQDPRLVTGPGRGNFLPLGMAFSFFLMWSLIGGRPAERHGAADVVQGLRRACAAP